MSVITINGVLSDLIVENGVSWASVRGAATADTSEPGVNMGVVTAAHNSSDAGPVWNITRSFMQFDTSVLSGVKILSIALEIFPRYDDPRDATVHVVDRGTASSWPFPLSDFGTIGSTTFGSQHFITGEKDAWIPIPLNKAAVLDYLNLTGNTVFGLREVHDLNNVEPDLDAEGFVPHRVFFFQDDESAACRLTVLVDDSGCSRIGPLPLEYRLAIGASCTRDSFDGTAILSLCQRDPNVSLDRCGALVNQNTRDYPDAQFAPRIGASSKTPRQLFRTGYGVRPAWDIEIRVATSRIGFLPMDAQRQPEVNDGSLWHLASILGLEAADVDLEPGTPNPPYLWLTVNYQHYLEQWIPVEVDPDNSSIDPVTINPETKTAERVMHVRFVARENYMRVLPAYFPSMTVKEIPGITVTALAAHVAVPDGGFTAAATLSSALPADLGLQDGLLVNVGGGRYSWKLYTIAAIDAPRTGLTLLTATDLSGAYLIPPSIPAPIRSVQQSDDRYLTTYVIRPFPGGQVAPPRGPQTHLTPQTYLLGDPYQDLA